MEQDGALYQYSTTGALDWHDYPTNEDKFYRISNDKGLTWSQPLERGDAGWICQYSHDPNIGWHDHYRPIDSYCRRSWDNGKTWKTSSLNPGSAKNGLLPSPDLKTFLGCGSILVVIFLVGFWLFGGLKPPKAQEPYKPGSYTIYSAVKSYVEPRLKSPASAKWQGAGSANIQEVSPSTWKVASYVDAPNSFGAMLRVRFVATVKCYGKDNWELVELIMPGQ